MVLWGCIRGQLLLKSLTEPPVGFKRRFRPMSIGPEAGSAFDGD
jgi:hypothetical protein